MTDDKQTGYEETSDRELKLFHELFTNDVTEYRKLLREAEIGLKTVQAELDRRALAAYWQAHPELLRVNVGDKVLVTEASFKVGDSDPVGSVNTVKSAYFRYHGQWGCMIKLDMTWGEVFRDLETVSDMRRAYLQAHPESEADR